MNLKLNSLYICVKNMTRAIAFYEKLFEQSVNTRDNVFSVFDIHGFRFCLFNNSAVSENVIWGDNCLPSFEVDDIDYLQKKINESNIEIVYPMTRINNNWVLEIKDCEGNDIEFYCKINA